MKSVDDAIQRLWENSGHGTRDQDIKAAWNEAIKFAAEIVRDNYDEQEPWLEVSDIEALYCDNNGA